MEKYTRKYAEQQLINVWGIDDWNSQSDKQKNAAIDRFIKNQRMYDTIDESSKRIFQNSNLNTEVVELD